MASLCSNVDFVGAKPLVWTFSIYLNMMCHQFDGDSSEIIASYGTLPIGMFTMRESPHDPNKYETRPFCRHLPVNSIAHAGFSFFSGLRSQAITNELVFYHCPPSNEIPSKFNHLHHGFKPKL